MSTKEKDNDMPPELAAFAHAPKFAETLGAMARVCDNAGSAAMAKTLRESAVHMHGLWRLAQRMARKLDK